MDKLVGPKVRICVTRFLPNIFLDAMKQNSEAAVGMLDSEHENPELIWNEDTRKKVRKKHLKFERLKPNFSKILKHH